MEKEILEKYKKAGEIFCEVKEFVLKSLAPGMRLLDLATLIEDEIKKRGGSLAFPPNLSINEVAAHYTPTFNDTKKIEPGDLLKIDVGVHIDGYIVDSAFTYCSEKNPMIAVAEKSIDAAVRVIKPGVRVSEISEAIEATVLESGFGLIVNLTGHTLDQYVFHGSPAIPNTKNNNNYEFKDGDVIALEPFVTERNSYVKESGIAEIYRYLQSKPVRSPEARKILDMAKNDFKALPFAKRWLYQHFSPVKVSLALKELENTNALESYPPLKHVENKLVAQSEHTIIVAEKPIVLTNP